MVKKMSTEFKTIPMEDIYVHSCKDLYSSEYIKWDEYLSQMVRDAKNLPPITVIKLSDQAYSLTDGYHRLSVFKYLNYAQVRCEVQ